MNRPAMGVIFASAVMACREPPVVTVEDGHVWQEVTLRVMREHRVVQIVALDDRPSSRLSEQPAFDASSDELRTAIERMAPGSWIAGDNPRDVALVLVFPASDGIVGPPEVPELRVRSPDFGREDADRIADAVRRALRERVGREQPYAPIAALKDAVDLLTGRRGARSDREARLAEELHDYRIAYDAAAVTGPFDDVTSPLLAAPGSAGEFVHASVLSLGRCGDGPATRTDATSDRRPVPCRELGEGAFWFSDLESRSTGVVHPRAVDEHGVARCLVEVLGGDLECEARGWRRTSPRRCLVPQLEGTDGAECRNRHFTCADCKPGWCAVDLRWGHVPRFVKNAFPYQRDAMMRITCNLE